MNQKMIEQMTEIRRFMTNRWNPSNAGIHQWWEWETLDEDELESSITVIGDIPHIQNTIFNALLKSDERILCRSNQDCEVEETDEYIMWDTINSAGQPITMLSLFRNQMEISQTVLLRWDFDV